MTLFAIGLLFTVSQVLAADLSACGNCHDWLAKPNSDVTKFILPRITDGSASGSTVDKSRCIVCHTTDLLPSHQNVTLTLQTVNSVTYGAFLLPGSLYQTPSFVHGIHNGISIWKMPGPTCVKCHGIVSCTSCHSSIPHKDHYSANPVNSKTGTSIVTPVLNVATGYLFNNNGNLEPIWPLPMTCAASECHQTLPAPKTQRTDSKDLCFNCHTTGLNGHDAIAIHATGYVLNPPLDCTQCHKTDLASEHSARADATGKAYDCLTCHKSKRPDVVTAIYNKSTNCNGCHLNYDHLVVHPSNIDINCQKCHKNNLVNEHLYNNITQAKTLNCQSCHKNTASSVQTAIYYKNTHCTACHNQGHNVNMASQVPADIPLYPGYMWSVNQPASIWAAEPWMDQSYVDSGRLVISNRRTDITGQMVYDYYKKELTAAGWSVAPGQPQTGSNYFKIEYIKNTRKLTIWFYGGENHNAEPLVPTGYRIELLYK